MVCFNPIKCYSKKNELGYFDSRPVFSGKDTEHPDEISVPCRKCIGCRVSYTLELTCKLLMHFATLPPGTSSCFLTLTYAEKYIPQGRTLNYCDLSTFIASFKKWFSRHYPNKNLEYIYSGEYGTLTHRPHFHIIFIGIGCEHLNCYFNTTIQQTSSKKIQDLWHYGYNVCLPVGEATLKYVAGYTKKKLVKLSKNTLTYASICTEERKKHAKRKGFVFVPRKDTLKRDIMFMESSSDNREQFDKELDDIIKEQKNKFKYKIYKGRKQKRNFAPYGRCYKNNGGWNMEVERVYCSSSMGLQYYKKYTEEFFKGYIELEGIKYKIPTKFMNMLKNDHPDEWIKLKQSKASFNGKKANGKEYTDDEMKTKENALKSRLNANSGGYRPLDMMDEEEEKILDLYE